MADLSIIRSLGLIANYLAKLSVHEWTKPRVVVADRTLLCVTQAIIAGNKSHMQFLMRICRYRYMGIVSYSGRQAVHGASSVYPLSLALIVSDDSSHAMQQLTYWPPTSYDQSLIE